MNIPKVYRPQEVESRWYRFWEERGYFRADPQKVLRGERRKFAVMMPPPNVTGILHMGHVLDNTLQDIIVRFRRMQGYEVLWQPGTDHAGIATQNVVEKRVLQEEGKTRFELGREELLKRIWAWKDEYEQEIIRRLKRLGVSCDWSRYRFTMEPHMYRAVMEAFVRLYRKGLIYRGLYIVNWCPRCGTTLADDEVEHEEVQGKLWYIRYPLVDGDGEVVVATTRPETYLGDTAVAVHPEDKRYKHLVGKKVRLPLVDWTRKGTLPDGTEVEVPPEIPIIADRRVDPEFGTGAVKVTPAHDPNDFIIGNEHNLPRVVMLDPEARTSENAGRFAGMDRYEARKAVVEALREAGYLVKEEPHTHAVGHCYRCNTVIEPYLSEQWFVRMRPLAEPAIRVVREGRLKLIPEYSKKIYFHWLENARDWAISRQIWWGHRIPVWYCQDCGHLNVFPEAPERCEKCGSPNLRQEEDVLDTWFSSWLWPFSTLGWPDETPELKAFYPTDVLVTGWDILFFWVARMIMAGLQFMGDIPFEYVYLHGIVRDERRRKISKSLGNFVDPMELFEKYGADGVRMGIMLIAPEGQDVIFSEKRIEVGRNFLNKVWNASRLLLLAAEGTPVPTTLPSSLALEDRWILTRLSELVERVTQQLESFEFNEVAWQLYDFFWHRYCDWYLEAIKPRMNGEGKAEVLAVAFHVLEQSLRLLHPYIPHITEEIWQRLPNRVGESIMIAPWPEPGPRFPEDAARFETLIRLAEGVREIRGEFRIKRTVPLSLVGVGEEAEKLAGLLEEGRHFLKALAGVEEYRIEGQPPHASATVVVGTATFYVPLGGLIDLEKERQRIQKEIEDLSRHLERVRRKLSNEEFLSKAPAEVVRSEEEKARTFEEKLAKLRSHLERLKS